MRRKLTMGIYAIYDLKAQKELDLVRHFTYGHFQSCPIYVGQSVDMEIRWGQHLKMLEKQCHHNENLQQHVNSIGIENISFGVLEDVQKKSDLNARELYWIQEFGWGHLCNMNAEKIRTRNDVDRYRRMVSILDSLGFMKSRILTVDGKTMIGRKPAGSASTCLDEALDLFNSAKEQGFEGGLVEIDGHFLVTFQ